MTILGAVRRLLRDGQAACRRRAALHHRRGAGAERRQGVRHVEAQRRLRLRLRPRLADRGDRDRLPDLLLGGGVVPRPGGARRHPPRGRAQRDRGGREGDRGMRIGRLDDETTANVGRIEGGTSANVVAERCYVELETRSLDAERAGEVVAEMVDALTEAASDCRVRRRDLRRAPVPGLPAPADSGAGRGRRGRSPRARDRADLHTDRWRQRCERLHPRGPHGREPRQRNGAQPPARRVGDPRSAGDHARGDRLARTAGGADGRADDARRLMERIGGEVVWEGRIDHGQDRPLPLRRRQGGRAGDRGASRRRGGGRPRRRAGVPREAAPRGRGRSGAAGAARPASWTRRGRARSTRPSASSPRRSARAPGPGST